jgi:hypothetical protein
VLEEPVLGVYAKTIAERAAKDRLNQKTAQEIGVAIPPGVLSRADRVIQ